MAGDPKNGRKPIKGKVLIKPNQEYSIFEDSNGRIYVLTERNANAALSAVYGDNYGRQIAGFATTETINFGISTLKGRAGAGTGEVLGTIFGKIVLKGGSKTIGDAIAGEEVSLGTFGYNITKELTKPTNYAVKGFAAPKNSVEEALDAAYRYKYGLTKYDPSIAKQTINIKGTKYGDIKLAGDISALSPGKQIEKVVVGSVKKQLFNKPTENREDNHARKQIDGFEAVDYENLDRLVASGLSESQALAEVTKAKTSRQRLVMGTLKKSVEDMQYNLDANNTFFTNLKHKYEFRNDDPEYREELFDEAKKTIIAKYGGQYPPEAQAEYLRIVKELWKRPVQREMVYAGGPDPIEFTLSAGAGIEQTIVAGWSALVNLTGLAVDIVNASTVQPTVESVNTKVTSKGYRKDNAMFIKNNFGTYDMGPLITGNQYRPNGFTADRSHLGPVRTTIGGKTKITAPAKRVDAIKQAQKNLEKVNATVANLISRGKTNAKTATTEPSLGEKVSAFTQLVLHVGFSKFGL
jgi:hypothetical protein